MNDVATVARGLSEAQRALLTLVCVDPYGCIPCDDARLDPFCGDIHPTDTINQCFELGLVEQLGCGDFDNFRIVPLSLGHAVRAHLLSGEAS